MGVKNLEELFVHELKDLHDAERQILKALPKMAEKSQHEELRSAFEEHRRQTEGHVRRLEEIFDDIGEKPGGVKCRGIRGIIEEGEEGMKEADEGEVRDAAMIAAAQRVEHYEMAAYGSARTFARRLGNSRAAELLQQTLNEEGETDHKLSRIAESRVNREAES